MIEACSHDDLLFLLADDGHSFDQVLFYGNEMTLLLFDMLTFCIADYIFMNYIVAGVITYLMSEVGCYYLSLVVRKPVFGVSDLVPHKSGCSATGDG